VAKRRDESPKKTGKVRYGLSLKDMIESGTLTPPVRLFRKTLGVNLEATLLPDGTFEFEGKSFPSCSTAAEYARSKATGRIMHTNGWLFWQLIDAKGKKKTLLDIRASFIEANGRLPHSE
jgi:hypothetical protein